MNMIKKILAPILMGAFVLVGGNAAMAHEVKSGDTMGKIASNYNISFKELVSLNPQVKNVNLIYVGDTIHTKTSTTPPAKVTAAKPSAVSSNELDLLARLVEAEASGEPYAGKVAVAYVVLNRVDSNQFPNSITAVINQSGQFTPVSNGEIKKPASAASKRAVNEAVNADRSLGKGSLFFYNSRTATNRWLDSRPTTMVIGNHTFKK
jgi:N-acetylmuramoyl-L-alanine amidase